MEQIFGAIPSVLSGLDPNESAAEAIVFSAWRRTAGQMLSERTAPVECFEDRLVIAVSDFTWQRHLEDLAPEMLARLNGALGQGTVRFIEFRIDPAALEESRFKRTAKPKTVEGRQPASSSLIDAANNIADESLRESFLNAATAYLDHKDA